MGNFDDYKREEKEIKARTGDMRVVIVDAEETVSKSSGRPMIVVTVTPSGSKAKIKEYIVKNEYFNQNMTTFFDAFPSIGEGNFNFMEWIGALGAAKIGLDENGYQKVRWFIDAKRAKDLPAFEGDAPVKQEVTSLDDDEDELPFV